MIHTVSQNTIDNKYCTLEYDVADWPMRLRYMEEDHIEHIRRTLSEFQ